MNKTDTDNIEYLKQILALVDFHKLDQLEICGIKVSKSKHVLEEIAPKKDDSPISDEDLYWSVEH